MNQYGLALASPTDANSNEFIPDLLEHGTHDPPIKLDINGRPLPVHVCLLLCIPIAPWEKSTTLFRS